MHTVQAAKSGTRLGDYRALSIQGGAVVAILAAIKFFG